MPKIYSKNVVPKTLKPKKEVVSFLLNYSKALRILKVQNNSIEVISN
ncbi:hypothetical protein SLW70_07825 [Flavobacterium sp. NG2]|nr:hypothetical protein [Flavobacterium sp. NG2]WPR73016.1 hypothetical protein SLW70_07825 [Flavobacterium sp. NG2]